MLISIVMPVYNAEATLKRSIESILKQTNPNWELICVDDGSKDDSLGILKQYADKDSRIKVFHKDNSGPGLTRNYAMERCVGDYIGYLDADDCWGESCVDELIKTIEEYNADVIFLRTMMCSGGKQWDAYNVDQFSGLSQKDIICCMMSGILPWGQEKVIRSSIIKDNGLTYSADPVGEEAIFSFEALSRAETIKFINQPMYFYYVEANGQHTLGNVDPWYNIVKNMKAHLEEKNVFDLYQSSLNSLALRALTISVYRISAKYRYKEAKKQSREKLLSYADLYTLEDNNSISLDKKTKVIYWLLKHKIYLPIYVLSKYRSRKK